MGKEEKSKVSIGTTIFWMIITAVMVCCIVSIKNTREMLTSEEYYDSIFGIKTYSGEFEKLKKVMGIIESDYLKEYDVKKLEEGAIRGMLEALDDPYTSYFDKSETESFLTETEGDYEGVGMYISIKKSSDSIVKAIAQTIIMHANR